MSTADVALLFPPMVDTNLGEYYPSTAVLSGYLRAAGLGAVQIDLNEELTSLLLDDDSLVAAAGGRLGPLEFTGADKAAVAARLLYKNRDRLRDDMGRHTLASDETGLTHLFVDMCAPLRVDAPLQELMQDDWRNSPVARYYADYFARSTALDAIGASHTVAISVPMGPQLGPTLLLVEELRLRMPDRAIIVGGPAPSLMSDDDIEHLLRGSTIDAVVRYEGELPLEQLVRQRAEGVWHPDQVPGASALVDGQVVHRLPDAGPPLDELPFAHYSREQIGRLADPEIGIIQARGCYWGKCAYCDYVELYDGSPAYRTRTPKRFVDELEYQVARHGARRIAVITESIPPSFARRMSEEIIERDLDVSWNSFAMVHDKFTEDVFDAMARSGCDYLVIGLETMDDRVLEWVHKAATNVENRHFLTRARDAGIDLKVNLIPNLPSTTYAEAMQALEDLHEVADCFSRISVFPFEATRSSAIGRAPERYGLQVTGTGQGDGQAQFTQNHLEVVDPAMSNRLEEVVAAYRNFADSVNSRSGGVGDQFPTQPIEGTQYQLADRYLDFHDGEKGLSCYHRGTRKQFEIPAHWGPALQPISAGAQLGSADLERLPAYQELFAHRMIQEVTTPPLD